MFVSGRQDDRYERHDEGGNEIVRRRQDDGQDGKVQMEKLTDAVRRQLEDDRRQDEDGMGWAIDVWKKGNERSRELGLDGQRVNLDDFFRRYKWEQEEQQQQQGRGCSEGSHSRERWWL